MTITTHVEGLVRAGGRDDHTGSCQIAAVSSAA
jgi:hypothetical protein